MVSKMALSISGILGRIPRPSFNWLSVHVPETANVQVRNYAARRGTREKRLKKQRALKLQRLAREAKKKKTFVSASYKDIDKTTESTLPPIPENSDIYIANWYKPKKYHIVDAVKCLKQDNDPSVLDAPNAKVFALIELNLVAEKKTKTVSPWRKNLLYPNIFSLGFKKRVLVLCDPKYVEQATEKGADMAGGSETIKKIKRGEFDVSPYDRIIGQASLHSELSTIRTKLKTLFPKVQDGSLSENFLDNIKVIKYGIEYQVRESRKEPKFGWIETQIGTLDMEPEKIYENFVALVKDVELKRPKREGDWITFAWVTAPPSKQRFCVDFTSVDSVAEKIDEAAEDNGDEGKRERDVASAAGA